MKTLHHIHPIFFILICTILEATGDAIVRKAVYNHAGAVRVGLLVLGMLLLLGYGIFLNLAPIEFTRVIGLYILTLFIVWQVISYISFKSVPTLPIIVGGLFIIVGGLIVSFWKPA